MSESADNVEAHRRWIELFNDRSSCEEFVALLDPEVEMITPGGPRLKGHEQAAAWFEKDFESFRPVIVPERFVEAENVVVGLGEIEMREVDSDETVQRFESAGVMWFRDGRVLKWQPFESHEAALEAAGVDG